MWCQRTVRLPSGPPGAPAPRLAVLGVSHPESGAGAGTWSTLLLEVARNAQNFLRKRPALLKGSFCSPVPGISLLNGFNSYNLLWSGDRKVSIDKHGQDLFLLNLSEYRTPLIGNALQWLKSKVFCEGSHHSSSLSTAVAFHDFQKCLSFLILRCSLLPFSTSHRVNDKSVSYFYLAWHL